MPVDRFRSYKTRALVAKAEREPQQRPSDDASESELSRLKLAQWRAKQRRLADIDEWLKSK